MRRRPECWWMLVMLAGCGGDGLRLAPVEGVVTLDGQPVANAGIVFSPASAQQGPPAFGATDQQGHFVLKTNNRNGAALGEHRVSISKADPYGSEVPAEELEMADVVRSRGLRVFKTKHFLPERYSNVDTSSLTATVQDQDNLFEFNLTSGPAK